MISDTVKTGTIYVMFTQLKCKYVEKYNLSQEFFVKLVMLDVSTKFNFGKYTLRQLHRFSVDNWFTNQTFPRRSMTFYDRGTVLKSSALKSKSYQSCIHEEVQSPDLWLMGYLVWNFKGM